MYKPRSSDATNAENFKFALQEKAYEPKFTLIFSL
jgi:hypothetical protein